MVEELKEDVAADMPKQKIILRRRVTPQRVRLPNGQSFLARYERVSRRNLPRSVTVKRRRQIRSRNRRKRKTQKGGNLFGTLARLGTIALARTGLLKKGLGVGVQALNSEIAKKLLDEGIKHAQEPYRLGTSKIKDKIVKRTLESEVANYFVQEAQKKAAENVQNLFG